MSAFFLKLVNMSISASWIVLAVLILRLLLKRAPKWITVLLWGIVAVRLICPFTAESVMSLIPSAETFSPDIMMDKTPEINTGIPIINNTINPVISESLSPDPVQSANPLQIWIPILSFIWIAGIVLLLAYALFSYFRVKRSIGTAVLLRENIYQSETIASPFVLGIIKPRIYLPFHISTQDMEHVIAHERAHIRRKDHLWKPLGFLILTLHWFNPFMWLGYVLLCRDIELACDEKVIKELNTEQKADYSEALLTCSVNRRMITVCPLAFGEVGVKDRIKSVLNYKKPAFWIIAVAIVLSIIAAVCFLTDPKSDLGAIGNQKSGSELAGLSLEVVSIETSAPDPYITIRYKNDTSHELLYGAEHYIYQKVNDSWEDCRIDKDNYAWVLIGFILTPGAHDDHVYGLNGQIMTEPGTYRFETDFSIQDDPNPKTKYKVWVEFELTRGADGMTVHTFDPAALVYADTRYSFVKTLDMAPSYRIVNAMQLQEISAIGQVTTIGHLERTKLDKDNFDSRFMGGSDCWLEKETLDKLKSDNLHAWQQTVSRGDDHLLYLLLEQKDGTFYLGYGHYGTPREDAHNSDDSHIRWLYRLKTVNDPGTESADGQKIGLGAAMNSFIEEQILEKLRSDYKSGDFCCTDFRVLGTEKNKENTVVYMWVLYHEYANENGKIENISGGHIPTVMTIKEENGGFSLVEYWEPRDGSYYAKDIRERFPWYLLGEAFDSQRYIEEQQANCDKKAREYFSSLSNVGGADEPENVVVSVDIERLKSKFPMYFDLDTSKGLDVYVWQMAEGSYSCGLLPGRDEEYTHEELWALHKSSTSLAEMKAIIDHYISGGRAEKEKAVASLNEMKAIIDRCISKEEATKDEAVASLNEVKTVIDHCISKEEFTKGEAAATLNEMKTIIDHCISKKEVTKDEAVASLNEVKTIIDHYISKGEITADEVRIHAVQMPHSSYSYTIDDAYRQRLNELFWGPLAY